MATGQERFRNSAAHGAFQRVVLLAEGMTATVPAAVELTDAAVLPLAVATASAGLFEADQLGLELPPAASPDRNATVLVWGGSTSVGSNAIQLARNAGYRVVTTASPRNHDLVRSLGAAEAFDYNDPSVAAAVGDALAGHRLAGSLAIGAGSLTQALRIARRTSGTGRIASAYPTPVTAMRRILARPTGVHISAIWGGSPARNAIGPAVFAGFLSAALADGRYRPAPPATVVGTGLAAIPAALEELRRGVSARKLVVTID